MPNDDFKLLLKSVGGQMLHDKPDANAVLASLIKDTVQFRDKLKEETGQILTVEDARIALDALETHLKGEKFPADLTPEQKALAQIYIDRVILFKLQ